jgi:hypothetical protein
MRRILTLSLAMAVLGCSPALANDADIERGGTCSGATSAELKLSPENGRIEVEFEVDQNRVGIRWDVVLRRNGDRVASVGASTRGPSGSFEVRRVLSDGAGPDRVFAKAVSSSGETCRAQATFP